MYKNTLKSLENKVVLSWKIMKNHSQIYVRALSSDVHSNVHCHTFQRSSTYTMSQKNCRCLVFYNVKTLELIFIIIDTLHPQRPGF